MNGKFFICACITAVLAIASASRADDTNAPVQTPEAQVRPGNLNGGQKPLGFSRVAASGPIAVFTPEQRASYQLAFRAERGRMLELEAKLRAARHEMDVASVIGKFDENAIREKALAAARIEAEMAVIRAKCVSKVQPPLSPEQILKIKSAGGAPTNATPLERPARSESAPATNRDANGLPPKQ